MTVGKDECKEAFERYLAITGYLRNVRADGKYESSHAQIIWESWESAWNARAALETPPAATPEEVLEAVAWAIAKAECQLETEPASDAERYRKLAEAAIDALERFKLGKKP